MVPIAILGGRGVGKTLWLLHSLGALWHRPQDQEHLALRFGLSGQQERASQAVVGLKVGRWPAATPETVPGAWCVDLARQKRQWRLYLYDLAGEECRTAARLVRHRYLQYLRGIVCVVDPFALPGVRAKYAAQLKYTRTNVRPSATALEDVVSPLLQALQQACGHAGPGQIDLSVAVVISKLDAFDLWRQVDIARGAIQSGDSTTAEKGACRQCLVEWGGGNAVRALEQHFARVTYFRYQTGAAVQYSPQRPLLWLLGLEPESG